MVGSSDEEEVEEGEVSTAKAGEGGREGERERERKRREERRERGREGGRERGREGEKVGFEGKGKRRWERKVQERWQGKGIPLPLRAWGTDSPSVMEHMVGGPTR